ncbi:MAG: TatD family hydrolase, partial [Candidatus Latescibacterota bacterium]
WIANHLVTDEAPGTRGKASVLPKIWDVRTKSNPVPTEVLEPLSLADFKERLAAELETCKAVAIGEVGLDFMIERPTPKGQFPILTTQFELAAELNLPVLLHCRNGWELLVSALQPFAGRIKGILHGYTRPPELAAPFIRIGLYVGIGGALTRETAVRTRRSAKELPLDRIVLETDAPSVGMEGIEPGRTEPCHVYNVAETMAGIRGTTVEDIAEATTNNFQVLFGI